MDEKTIPLDKLPVDVKVHLNSGKSLGTTLDYRALFEQTGEAVLIIGLNFKVITANPKALQLLGYAEGDLIGTAVEDLMMLDESVGRDVILGNRQQATEQTLKRKDGLIIPVELSISVVHDQKAMPAYIQLVARDITERKQADRALKRHMRALSVIGEVTAGLFRSPKLDQRIPEVLETLSYAVGIFSCAIFDIKNGPVQVKYQWTDQTAANFEVEKVITPFAQSLAEMPERVFSVTDVQTDCPAAANISLLVIPIQGTLGFWGFLGLFDRDDRLSWLPTIFDIVQTTANLIGAAMERVHYEEVLRLSEARNRIIVDVLPDVLIRIDRFGRVLDFFAKSDHPLYPFRNAVLGRSLLGLFPEDAAHKLLGEDNRPFAAVERLESFTLPQVANTFEAELHPISEREALIIIRDITERAHLDQMKSDFINRASHELRTPLTSAILMADLIQQGGTPEELDEYWRTLNSELNRQKNLINELLMAGRLESGNMRLESAPMDLMPTLLDSVNAVKPIANKKKVTLAFESAFESLLIWGDKGGLQQVFINLINNAVKFSPENETVEIKVTLDEEMARVSISDHGLGIPPEALLHLFERFYRAQNVTVAEVPGSGIGLYIVKSILDGLKGTIQVHSEAKRGSTFVVGLKLVK
ncbi:MAG: PAS domain S-box protein [Anaerolineales bacterium]|nr:PAS domain S-box protein [Anaerolineales bacterium]MCZ2122450.1 PAS domain S-box protein [Anaerolineales bacterium]